MEEPVEIGAYEVKSRLSDLLAARSPRGSLRTTQRREPAAELVPASAGERLRSTSAAAQLREFIQGTRRKADVKALIEEERD